MSDGKVVFKYTGDTSGIDKANDEAEVKTKSLGSRLGGVAKAIGAALVTALAAATAAVIGFAKKGIELASDLNEVQNVVDVTFGDGAKQIDEWAKTAANAFGMSELEAKQYTGTMGAMLKSMGLTSDQTIEMSKSLAGLAGDMSSFYNLNHEDAWEKIRSGIAGETEPLKQLGINMDVANLEAFALAEGLDKPYAKMSQSEQTLLRYNYLMSVTADAQGDFARTSDSWANQLRLASMSVDTLAASFGQTLLPALAPVLKAFNDTAVPKLSEALEGLAQSGVFDKLGESLGQLVGALSGTFAELIGSISDLAKTLSDTLAVILPVIVDLINDLLPPLMAIVNAVLPVLTKLFDKLMPVFKEIIDKVMPVIVDVLDELIPPLTKLIEAVLPIALELFEKLVEPILKLAEMLLPSLASIIDTISMLMGALNPLFSTFFDLLGPLIKLLSGGLAVALGVVADALSIIVGLIGLIVESIKWLLGKGGDFQRYLDMLSKPFTSQGSTIAAINAASNSDSSSTSSSLTPKLDALNAGKSDADLTDKEWYDKYMTGHNARGTRSWRGGLTWVGEEGPELVDLPGGARVYSADMSAAIAAAPSTNTRNDNMTVNELKVYPDQVEYLRILKLLESSDKARQNARAEGR